jgi:carboxypeptidase Taq
MNNNLTELAQFQKKTWYFKGISSLLDWDSKTYMPEGGIEARSQQVPLVEGVIHERITSPEYRKLLDRLIDVESGEIRDASLTEREQRWLKESLRDYRLAVALPNSFVQEMFESAAQSQYAWVKARETDDFALFAPHLEKMVSLCKRKAGYLALGKTPYDSLLNAYEPGASTEELDPVFEVLKHETIALIGQLPRRRPEPAFISKDYDAKKQMTMARDLMRKLGASPENIRLDLTAHPFCTTIHCKDVRITTRLDGLAECQLTILHETGHALYELGLPGEWFGTPLGEATSMSIHESQSRFWEVFVGKSRAFWETQYPILQSVFTKELRRVSFDRFYAAVSTLGPSLIRVRADELTYNLHIIIRYEMEKAMINGSVRVEELPDMWNAKYEQYLGLRPPTFSQGILQDIHWSFGDLGYFPTYTLGNLFAAHWWEQINKDVPGVEALIRAHDFAPILQWHREKIHAHGRARTSSELVRDITGGPLSPQPLIRFLRAKVAGLH